MNPAVIIAGFQVLDGALKLIAEMRAQGGMSDDEIMAHAQASVPNNAALIKSFLDSLPPVA